MNSEVLIQGINVMSPFKIEHDENIYKFNDRLELLYYSFVTQSWNKSYVPIQRIVVGTDKIRPVHIWSEKEIALLGNLYLFGYRTIEYTDTECIAYTENKTDHLIMNDYSQYNNIVEYLFDEEEWSWEIAEILTEVGSNIPL